MEKEDLILVRHLADLARTAYYNHMPVTSDFLNLYEQSLFWNHLKELEAVSYEMNGGFEDAERCMIGFYTEYSEALQFPISCIKVEPVMAKFSDRLTHRDFLGAVLNLGMDRSKTGDILVEDNVAYIYCHQQFAHFITENLEFVRHTRVKASIAETEIDKPTVCFKTKQGTVSSIRLDSIIALAFSLSRSKAQALISGGLVYVNGRLTASGSAALKNDDIISVRKTGRFKLELTDLKSKKDKFVVKTHIFN